MGFRTRRSYAAVASSLLACTLSASFASAADLNAMTYKGCYSSSQPLSDQGYYQYQTNGYCQPICVNKNQAVLGLSKGSDCWCGNQLPAANTKVDDSKCNTPCNGFGDQMCGGTNYYSVYLTGTTSDVSNYGDSTSNSPSSDTNNPDSSSTSATPSVVTSISPGSTVVITVSASATNTSNNSSGGTSTAGVAAGVVVGIVGAGALAGGIFFLIRRRRRQRAEEDYKRSAQISDFMTQSSDRRSPNTAYSQMSDSRLDPEHGRRNSVGSMADDHDYSRRILRVANPDSH